VILPYTSNIVHQLKFFIKVNVKQRSPTKDGSTISVYV